MNNFRRLLKFSLCYINYENKCIIKRGITWGVQKTSNITLNNEIQSNLQFVRNYAKAKDKKKEKGKSKVVVNEAEISSLLNVDSLKKQFEKPLEVMKNEYMKQLSLRTSAGTFEMLTVNFEGKDYTLQEIAQIVRKNPTTLIINMSVFPQAIPTVLKTIQKSGLSLNPQQEGTTLYVPIPKVTQEHRENLSKTAKQMFIKCKDSIRDAQNKHTKSLKKKENVSEDMTRSIEQQVITMADGYVSQAEAVYNAKTKELLGKN